MKTRIKKLSDRAIVPTYGTEFSAGADLYACVESDVKIGAGETVFIPTGIAMEIPVGYAGLIYARSGLASKKGLAPANKVGVVDSDYRGEVIVALYNQSQEERVVSYGERIAQMVIAPFVQVEFEQSDTLDDTARGGGGFGSTGK